MNEKKQPYEASEKQINEWKAKHGADNIHRIVFEDAACYVRTPNRIDLGMSGEMSSNSIDERELLLNEIWLAGDEVIRKDDRYFLRAISFINGLVQVKAAELKKV